MTSQAESLESLLAHCLPLGHSFRTYHVSTPPTLTCALYTPPPGTPPEKTYCESHLLLVAHDVQKSPPVASVSIFALEILVYTTAHLTTVFVSKADSTGFAANLPSTASSSILRSVASTFIAHTIRHRTRPDRRLVISLFARAQDQYLFPGSVENRCKHVLNDRQLVRWWCRTLHPVLRNYPSHSNNQIGDSSSGTGGSRSKAHLIVPGYDKRETAALFPPSARHEDGQDTRWHNSHPLRDIAPYNPHTTAPRSLIPHFPDDPKSRFLLDLDEEISDVPTPQQSSSQATENKHQQPSPRKRGTGMWKSVKSIEQFWEMMAWRQECASGRLVGFLWITIEPPPLHDTPSHRSAQPPPHPASPSLRPAKRKRAIHEPEPRPEADHTRQKPPPRTRLNRHCKLTGAIHPRAPRVKTSAAPSAHLPEKTPHFYWPPPTRGNVVCDEKAYQRVHEILLRLDFTGMATAAASTAKWAAEVAVIAGCNKPWGVQIEGRAALADGPRGGDGIIEGGTTLDAELVRKKAGPGAERLEVSRVEEAQAHVLGAGLVRKRPKV